MKSETKNKIIIIQFIVIFIFIGYIIFSSSVQGRKDREYKNTIAELETTIITAREENTELNRIITGLENTISKNGKTIKRLESLSNELRENNQSSIETITEIERLFTEIMGD